MTDPTPKPARRRLRKTIPRQQGKIVVPAPKAHRWSPEDEAWIISNQASVFREDAMARLGTTCGCLTSKVAELAARGLVDRRTSTITRRRPVSRLDLGYAGFGIFIEGPRKWVGCIIPTRR